MKHILFFLSVFAVIFSWNCNISVAQWVKISNDFGGEVQCFAAIGNDLFVGSDGGGVFVSTDNGMHWSASSAGLSNKKVHGLLASSGELLAGTSGGVYLSTNNGSAWLPLNAGLADTTTVHALLLNGTTLYAGTSGGVYRALQGANWEKIDTGFTDDYYVNTFIMSDTNLLAGTFVFGVWRSTDNGSHWDQSNSGLTKSDMHSFAEFNNELYVVTDGAKMFVSDDNGHSWGEVPVTFQAGSLNNLLSYSSPVFGKNQLFVASDNGVYRTVDKAVNWTNLSTGLTNLDARILFQNSGFLFAAIGDSTLWRSQIAEVSVKENDPLSLTIKNYPNPFSEKTTITFTSTERGFVEIIIVNILGEEVAKVFSGELETGEHDFNLDEQKLADGMYVCLIRTNDRSYTLPMLKIR